VKIDNLDYNQIKLFIRTALFVAQDEVERLPT